MSGTRDGTCGIWGKGSVNPNPEMAHQVLILVFNDSACSHVFYRMAKLAPGKLKSTRSRVYA